MKIVNRWIRNQQVRVYMNPTLREQSIIQNRHSQCRTLTLGRFSCMWEAYLATHYDVARELGIDLAIANLGNT